MNGKKKQTSAIKKLKLSNALKPALDSNIFEQIVDNFPDIIHSVDKSGVIVQTNKTASELLGFSREELIGKNVLDLYADDIREQVIQGFEELKLRGMKDRIESRMKTKDGRMMPVEIRSLSLYDEDGHFVRTFTIIRDMRKLNELRSQLLHQNRLASIGELASSIVHEIRNPLSVVSSYGDIINEAFKKDDKEKILMGIDQIMKASARMERITSQLKEFIHKSDETEPKFCQLNMLLEDAILIVDPLARKNNAKITNKVRGNIHVFGDASQLEQVFVNLLANACDAVADRPVRDIVITAEDKPDTVIISVHDTGCGIKKNDMDKIFDAFFTTKPKGSGTGLGLSITIDIVKRYGGTMQVRSTPDKGSDFTVILPHFPEGGVATPPPI